ncbi:hypothetical protein SERLADRAFT_437570 [Serpula lacrymans var. lacrymans S7.9]|uniref:DUF6532 domain-containing protein n=1 Tax=Serpula lacrymans var. lacrymans (strain S7.9) TaxID=578457 RepID=F8NUD6_SERL9|nr:uncharacterized protein SERLADRAFT_437570 [Serpula lacrymans var. lacrymans S7.9]EGO25848.1 hypothetical protein SERLADRAFT_437570 [Serpula lacrymans var. lacrymans S7.9]
MYHDFQVNLNPSLNPTTQSPQQSSFQIVNYRRGELKLSHPILRKEHRLQIEGEGKGVGEGVEISVQWEDLERIKGEVGLVRHPGGSKKGQGKSPERRTHLTAVQLSHLPRPIFDSSIHISRTLTPHTATARADFYEVPIQSSFDFSHPSVADPWSGNLTQPFNNARDSSPDADVEDSVDFYQHMQEDQAPDNQIDKEIESQMPDSVLAPDFSSTQQHIVFDDLTYSASGQYSYQNPAIQLPAPPTSSNIIALSSASSQGWDSAPRAPSSYIQQPVLQPLPMAPPMHLQPPQPPAYIAPGSYIQPQRSAYIAPPPYVMASLHPPNPASSAPAPVHSVPLSHPPNPTSFVPAPIHVASLLHPPNPASSAPQQAPQRNIQSGGQPVALGRREGPRRGGFVLNQVITEHGPERDIVNKYRKKNCAAPLPSMSSFSHVREHSGSSEKPSTCRQSKRRKNNTEGYFHLTSATVKRASDRLRIHTIKIEAMPENQFAEAEKVLEEVLKELNSPCKGNDMDHHPDDIKEQVARHFPEVLNLTIMNTMYGTRGNFKSSASSMCKDVYGLCLPADNMWDITVSETEFTKDRVVNLLKKPNRALLHGGIGHNGKCQYFQHPAVINIILDVLYKVKTGLGHIFSSQLGPLAAHVTIALAATALYAVLKELKTGVFEPTDFSVNAFRKFYKEMSSLIFDTILQDNDLKEDYLEFLAFVVARGILM